MGVHGKSGGSGDGSRRRNAEEEKEVEGGISNAAFDGGEPPQHNNNKISSFVAEDEDQSSREGCSLFGLVSLPCCKPFLTAPWILVFLCWASTVQGMVVNGFVNVVISTLERRFGLPSTQSGIIVGCYDIGSMLTVIPISYFGGRLGTSKPRYIALGLLLMGSGSLLFSLPQFFSDQYLPKEVNALGEVLQTDHRTELCNVSHSLSPESCDGAGNSSSSIGHHLVSSLSNYRYFFFFGQVLHGVGAAPLITLGTTLLDESVSKANSPMYIGIFQTMFVIGPAIGYIVGGQFLDMYVDLNVETVPVTSDGPLWVGAWWIGFLLAWILAWACAFFVGLYPAVLPGAEGHNQVKAADGFGSLKELPVAIRQLLVNPTYMFIQLGSAMDGFSISCLAAFMPKFMQYQYGLSSSLAAIVVGVIVVPAGGGGTFLGGYLTRRLRLTRSGVIRMYMWCQLVTVPMALGFFLTCPNPVFSGVNAHYSSSSNNNITSFFSPPSLLNHVHQEQLDGGSKNSELRSSCNAHCSSLSACSLTNYNPVCGADNRMYFNPCLAGCGSIHSNSSNSSTVFGDCSCVLDIVGGNNGSSSSSQIPFEQTAQLRPCDVSCSPFMYGFISTALVLVFFTFVSAMPSVIATLRAVEPVHRSLALGMGSIVTRILGAIPGPILFGYLIDQTCLLWQQQHTHERGGGICNGNGDDDLEVTGNCLLYDNYEMGIKLLIVILSVKALAVIFFAFALFFSKRSSIKDDVDS